MTNVIPGVYLGTFSKVFWNIIWSLVESKPSWFRGTHFWSIWSKSANQVKRKPNEDVQTWDLDSMECLGHILEWLWRSTHVEKSQPKSTVQIAPHGTRRLNGCDLATWRSKLLSIQGRMWNKSRDFIVIKWREKDARNGWRHQDSFYRQNGNIFSLWRNELRKLSRMDHTTSKLYSGPMGTIGSVWSSFMKAEVSGVIYLSKKGKNHLLWQVWEDDGIMSGTMEGMYRLKPIMLWSTLSKGRKPKS